MDIEDKSKAFGEVLCMTIYKVNANVQYLKLIPPGVYVYVFPAVLRLLLEREHFKRLTFFPPYDPKLSASPPDGDELTSRAVGAAGHARRRRPHSDTSTVTDRANERVVSRHENEAQPSIYSFLLGNNPTANTFLSPPAPAELTCLPICTYRHVKIC